MDKNNETKTTPQDGTSRVAAMVDKEDFKSMRSKLSGGSSKSNISDPQHRIKRYNSSKWSDKDSQGHSGKSKWHAKSKKGILSRCMNGVSSCFGSIWNYIVTKMVVIPLVHDPISYCRPEDYTKSGDRIFDVNETDDEATLDMIEAACNYSENTSALFEKVLSERKESAESKKRLSGNLNFDLFPPWDDSMLDRLQCIFQIFDESGDGVVDLDEMTNMMIDFGDKSTEDDRQRVFSDADVSGKGSLNFTEFVTMLHNVMVKAPDKNPATVVATFRQIDRNMARIRGLDVVQQLQAGLF